MPRALAINVLLVACLLAGQAGSGRAGDARSVLHINPFEHPIIETLLATRVVETPQAEATELRLRAVMLAGTGSLANIGGTLVGIGEEIEGYRLVSISERSVVLNKNGTARTLSIDD